jgi:hypothetical protein
MSTAESQTHWADANQRRLVAEFAWLKRRLESGGGPGRTEGRPGVEPSLVPAAIDVIGDVFALSAFERDMLLLCAGVEMDAELAGRCGAVTFGLALATLDHPHWSATMPDRPLRRWRLIELDETVGVAAGRVRIDERVLHYLAGVNAIDPRLRPFVRRRSPPLAMADSHRRIGTSIVQSLRHATAPVPAIVLAGDDPDGQSDVAAHAASQLGLGLHEAHLEDLPRSTSELEAFMGLWQREAALLGSALLVECGDAYAPRSLVRMVEAPGSVVFLAVRDHVALRQAVDRFTVVKPQVREQRQLWEDALGPDLRWFEGSLASVVSQFRLSARTIHTTALALRARVGTPAQERSASAIWEACRVAGRSRLDDLAQRLVPTAGWDDLVLPAPQKAALAAIAAHARHRLQVLDEWGFADRSSRGLGLTALFAGESGTGKTMAAEILANELQLDLYRIDLSAVVSKYIGETEKNLRRVFDAAEDGGAILLFDEADALFGKRSEVRDSHDRYANIEVSYLLQRMEAYRGLAILTTNMKASLDNAFQRRLRFVVHFPFPDASGRAAIWRSAFPPAAPTEGLDVAKLARLNMSGGNIRNIALDAAFRAAEDRAPVCMAHVLQAAHSEAAKRDRPLSDAETRGWI